MATKQGRPKPLEELRELKKSVGEARLVSDDYADKTYFYLRVGMVAMVLLLGTSVIVEGFVANCVRTSVSAYYHSPARSIFVGTMVAMGLCLIAIKGRTVWEDISLNLAGIASPVVAFVPTRGDGLDKCGPGNVRVDPVYEVPSDEGLAEQIEIAVNETLQTTIDASINNNLLSAAIVGIALLLFAVFMARNDGVGIQREEAWGLVLAAIALIGGFGHYLLNKDQFLERAHGMSALLLFTFLIGAIWMHAYEREQKGDGSPLLRTYKYIAIAMGAAGLLQLVPISFDRKTLWVEAVELLLFLIYWALQTRDDGSLPEPALARQAAAARAQK
ncbi:MAG: hypothetical protein GY929_01670 [Actinomycetia bacterium]|nr:hypothetical protein [Actinomycetes bacterium]